MREETFLIRNQHEQTSAKEHTVPIYFTSSYTFDSAEEMRSKFAEEEESFLYSRYSNPNVDEFISKVAHLEGAESGWATATGMASVFTTFGALLDAGDHVLSSRSIFGSTHKLFTEILPRFGITASYGSYDDVDAWEALITTATKCIYIESPTNPALDIIDVRKVAALAEKHNLILVVDNCFATPVLQQPIKLGAHISIHSATKFIDGQGRAMGGLILGSNELIEKVKAFARHTGPALSPFNAWILSKSLETLSLRVEKHCSNALEIATRLEKHKALRSVKYPFLKSHKEYEIAVSQMHAGGGLVGFELEGGLEAGKKFLDALKMIKLTANLGDVRTIATHPASTTHSKLTPEQRAEVGITDGFIRISVGLEHVEDIWEDIEQALAKCFTTSQVF
ncbi:MAG: aminotransferase class I/II-fold pyridoxal phosphate-dependent enzyme [Crocinitomicaceae bacterium]|nr:aminotransferase class I/II-fold pyridoxal phosphate-dependent enzyme [Crocinitomicaceae bacterium]